MVITNQIVAERLAAYLRREITLAQLVDWAENALLMADFDERGGERLSAIVARLGVSDVRAFGLTWEDCESIFHELGYDARVEVAPA